ncbi:MAG: isocitrate/isopropylmalate dehydrogenase family protein [Ignisphaera sp.]
MVKRYKIGVLKGDGIGPEIVDAALHVLNALGIDAEFVELRAGYEYYKRFGKPLEEGFFDVAKKMDAILKGPLYTPPHEKEFKSINILIRKELDLYANVRPFKSFKGFSLKDFNFVIVRENSEDVYVGIEGLFKGTAISLRIITYEGAKRIAEYAFSYAKKNGFKKVTVVHKANVLKISDGLFRDVFFEVAKRYPDITAEEIIVDTAAYTIVRNPERLGVMVTPNLYGDILSDLAAAMVGSLGLCGSAQIGSDIAVFEPVHGTAPDIAGKGIANPIGEIEAAKLMLYYLYEKFDDADLHVKAKNLDKAIHTVVEDLKILTPDLGGTYKTVDVVNALVKVLNSEIHS